MKNRENNFMANNKTFSLEIFSLTDEKLELEKEQIKAILNSEMSKPENEMNIDLINECLDYLSEAEGLIPKTKEELTEIVNKIKNADNSDEICEEEKTTKAAKKMNWRFIRIAAVAAIITSILTITIVALDDIKINLEILFSSKEDFTDANGDDYGYIGSDVKQYSTAQELADSEIIKFLYPTVLPDGLEIIKWDYYIHDGVQNIAAILNDPLAGYAFLILNEEENIDAFKKNGEKIEINGLTVYAVCYEYGCYARWIYNDRTYGIRHSCALSRRYQDTLAAPPPLLHRPPPQRSGLHPRTYRRRL